MKSPSRAIVLLLLETLIPFGAAVPSIRDVIPNGHRVPNPCAEERESKWYEVEATWPDGGGVLNPFGEDFHRNGFKWDECLCKADSDGDGKTNGEELGDPDCEWTPVTSPEVTDQNRLSHPGIYEQLEDGKNWDGLCTADLWDEYCPYVSDDIQENLILAPQYAVPVKETAFMCMTFDLPSDKKYHLTAVQPLLDNIYYDAPENYVHDVFIWGCDETAEPITTPTECDMSHPGCLKTLIRWSVGTPGHCFPPEFAPPVGQGGPSRILVQIVTENPHLLENSVDSSGVRIFYTDDLRPNDGAMLTLGQESIAIPPGAHAYPISGVCGSSCTEDLPHDIFLGQAMFHMHNTGTAAAASITKPDKSMRVVVDQPNFVHDSPDIHSFPADTVLEPGDALTLTCVYDTTKKPNMTYYGRDELWDEMCYSYVYYYPMVDGFDTCIGNQDLDVCAASDPAWGHQAMIDVSCDIQSFLSNDVDDVEDILNDACGTEACNEGCKELISQVQDDYPCMSPEVLHEVKSIMMLNSDVDANHVVKMLHSCDPIPAPPPVAPHEPVGCPLAHKWAN